MKGRQPKPDFNGYTARELAQLLLRVKKNLARGEKLVAEIEKVFNAPKLVKTKAVKTASKPVKVTKTAKRRGRPRKKA